MRDRDEALRFAGEALHPMGYMSYQRRRRRELLVAKVVGVAVGTGIVGLAALVYEWATATWRP